MYYTNVLRACVYSIQPLRKISAVNKIQPTHHNYQISFKFQPLFLSIHKSLIELNIFYTYDALPKKLDGVRTNITQIQQPKHYIVVHNR